MKKNSDGERKNYSVSMTTASNGTEGEWHVTRKIVLPTMNCEFSETRLGKTFGSMEGIDLVSSSCNKAFIVVRYDIRHTFYSDVLGLLKNAGFPPKNNWWQVLRARWFGFTEDNMRSYSKAKVTSCCNKPPIGSKH